MSDLQPIPIDAFFDSTNTRTNEDAGFDVRNALHDAEVIVGRDVMSGREFILYGREMLQRVARGDEPEGVPVLCIALDQDGKSGELERALALIVSVKGRHDYIAFRDAETE